jgi:hypothetical protein
MRQPPLESLTKKLQPPMRTEPQLDGTYLSEQRLANGRLLLCEADTPALSKHGLIIMLGERIDTLAKPVEFLPAEPSTVDEVYLSADEFKNLFGDR